MIKLPMIKIVSFVTSHVRTMAIVSITLNIILIGSGVFLFIKNNNISNTASSSQKLLDEIQKVESSRMNGVFTKNGAEHINIKDIIEAKNLSKLNLAALSNLEFSSGTYDYRNKFDYFWAGGVDNIYVDIEKMTRGSTYLIPTRSEFLGVSSIDDLARAASIGYYDPKIFNSKVNGIPFSKFYFNDQIGLAEGLTYRTVLRGSDDNFYYISLTAWENIMKDDGEYNYEMRDTPEVWFKNHPSEKFNQLESLVSQLTQIQ